MEIVNEFNYDSIKLCENISLGHVVFEYCNFQEKDKWCQPKRGENGVGLQKLDITKLIHFWISTLAFQNYLICILNIIYLEESFFFQKHRKNTILTENLHH